MDIIDERGRDYGDPRPNHERIADLIGAYLGITLTAQDAAVIQCLVKISRIKASGGQHADSFLDAKAYLEIAERLK